MESAMSIWFKDFPLDYVNQRGSEALPKSLGIEVLEAGDDFLLGSMQVDHRSINPAGYLHGGASVAFAETLASWAGTFVLDATKKQCVGLEINANHIRPVAQGKVVYGKASPESLGRMIQVWTVRITNDEGKLVCSSRVTLAVLDRPSEY